MSGKNNTRLDSKSVPVKPLNGGRILRGSGNKGGKPPKPQNTSKGK